MSQVDYVLGLLGAVQPLNVFDKLEIEILPDAPLF